MITSLEGIKHISLDFWNTLAIPNLEYSKARTELIAELTGLDFNESKRAYTSTKRFMDTAAELTGFAMTRSDVVRMLNAQLPRGNRLTEDKMSELMFRMDFLFSQNVPTVPEDLVAVLTAIKERGITMNILSNTNFTQGTTLLETVVTPVFGNGFFLYTMFSDQWEMAKPHEEFFLAMVRHAMNKNDIKRSEILHIGDNLITDVRGGEQVQVNTLHCENPTNLAAILKDMLQ